MARALKRLVSATLMTNSSVNQVLYTAPALTTTIIRHIHVFNNHSVDQQFSFACNATAATSSNRFLDAINIPTGQSADFYGDWVLAAGETLNSISTAANSLTYVTVFGEEIT